MCAGYYSYRHGYTPEFAGIERFRGTLVHPQQWPDGSRLHGQEGRRDRLRRDGDDAGTGDGARTAEHIVMLQRSPTYVVSRPDTRRHRQRAAQGAARALGLRDHALEERRPAAVPLSPHAHPSGDRSSRSCSTWCGRSSARTTTSRPTSRPRTTRGTSACAWCRTATSSPRSAPARRRSSPIRSSASPRSGIRLASGRQLDADIIVTATGLNLVVLGEMQFEVDGAPVDFSADLDLQGHDVLRRAEPGLHVRLHQRVVDAARRPHLRVRLPPASTTWTRRARSR